MDEAADLLQSAENKIHRLEEMARKEIWKEQQKASRIPVRDSHWSRMRATRNAAGEAVIHVTMRVFNEELNLTLSAQSATLELWVLEMVRRWNHYDEDTGPLPVVDVDPQGEGFKR